MLACKIYDTRATKAHISHTPVNTWIPDTIFRPSSVVSLRVIGVPKFYTSETVITVYFKSIRLK